MVGQRWLFAWCPSCARSQPQAIKHPLLLSLPPDQQQNLEAGATGRVIVFTNYREGVMGICEGLRPHEPLVTARSVVAVPAACCQDC